VRRGCFREAIEEIEEVFFCEDAVKSVSEPFYSIDEQRLEMLYILY
jgi:hypothetical protein